MATNKSKTRKVSHGNESRLSIDSVRVSGDHQIAVVSFKPNSSRNAFGEAEAKALLQTLALKDISGLLWLGHATSTFCSGGDLTAYSRLKNLKTEGQRVNRLVAKALNQLSTAGFPTVVAVDGDCWGGGVELLSAFNYVICSPNVLFGLWQTRMALIPGWGGYRRLAQRVSEAKLKSLLLRQAPITSNEALGMGLVDELAPLSRLNDMAKERLVRMMRVEKKTLASVRRLDLKNEQKLFESLWASAEHREKLNQKF